jgi:xanthine dehydrogenase FAD-binding subunit
MSAHYLGPGRTALAPAELLTAIRIPRASWERTYGCYIKYAMRNAMDIATLGCSVNLRLTPDGRTVERLRLAYGVAGPVPMRAPSAEQAAAGKPWSEALAAQVAKAALSDLNPRTSWRATKELRLQVAEELAKRAIIEAAAKARKGGT